jgi:hypothetical protein
VWRHREIEAAGIATLPQESRIAGTKKVPIGTHSAGGTATCRSLAGTSENLQAIACNVPCVHSMFIEVPIVPVRDKLHCGEAS